MYKYFHCLCKKTTLIHFDMNWMYIKNLDNIIPID